MDAPATRPRRTLVLLPGLDGTGRLFRPIQEALGPGIETSVISYPADKPLGYDALWRSVLRELPDEPHAIVAESFSGSIALKVAARKPRGLRALVLSASFAENPRPWLLPAFSRFLGLYSFWPRLPMWLIRASMVGVKAPEELCIAIQKIAENVDPKVMAFRLREIMRCDATADLRACPVPIFYLNGINDRLLSKGALRSISKIRPDATVIDVAGPHLLLQAVPDTCARHIRSALESLD